MKRFEYLKANVGPTSARSGRCEICGAPISAGRGYIYLEYAADSPSPRLVLVCRKCHTAGTPDAEEIRRDYAVVEYRIESGWENNPIWMCPVQFVPEARGVCFGQMTTAAAGEPPSLVDGESSGLFFRARGSSWPIEAREGRLVLVMYRDDRSSSRYITPAQAWQAWEKGELAIEQG